MEYERRNFKIGEGITKPTGFENLSGLILGVFLTQM